MRNGVPFDVAMTLPGDERLAWTVVFGEFEGGQFDWQRGRWKDRKP